jgi:hypothetical protein
VKVGRVGGKAMSVSVSDEFLENYPVAEKREGREGREGRAVSVSDEFLESHHGIEWREGRVHLNTTLSSVAVRFRCPSFDFMHVNIKTLGFNSINYNTNQIKLTINYP